MHTNSATLIDNIFSSNVDEPTLSGNIVSDISDHYSQFCISRSENAIDNHQKRTKLYRDFRNFSGIKFNDELSQLNLSTAISRTNDPNKSFSLFYNKLQRLINKHAPSKPVSKRERKRLSKPWITQGLRKSIKIKNSLFYSGDIDMYKYYRNKIVRKLTIINTLRTILLI